MRIAIWHNLPSGGGKRAFYYHVRELVRRGHMVEVWCPPTADLSYLPFDNLVKEHVVPFSWKPPSLRRPIQWMMNGSYTSVDKIGPMQEHCRRCAEEIERGGFDVFLAHPCRFLRVPPFKYQLMGIPKVLYLQEPYRWLYEALPVLPWSALPFRQGPWFSLRYLWTMVADWFYTYGLRRQAREELWNASAFDRILVNSLFSRESVRRAYGLDSRVCYLGVDAELFQPSGAPRERFLLGLGYIYEGKGIDRAVRALGAVPKHKRVDLVWVGNGGSVEYGEEMGKLAEECGVKLTIKMNVPDGELLDLLNRAYALIYTSRLEPFGFAPLEANACETPVVAIAEGGIRESVTDGVNGILVNDEDPAVVGEALLRLLDDPDLARAMGKRAREHVLKNWSWEASITRLEQHLLEVVKAGSSGKQRSFTPEFKTRIVLEILSGLKSQAEVCRQHGLEPERVAHWRATAIEGLPRLFQGHPEAAPPDTRITEREHAVGRQAQELESADETSPQLEGLVHRNGGGPYG